MRKALIITGSVVAAVLFLGVTAYAFANAPAPGSMGVWGYVVSPANASLDVAPDQVSADASRIVVAGAKAPQAAWIVVHNDDNGKPGMRVGLVHIDKGVSTDVEVPLKDVEGDKVIVAIHADMGTEDKFDFDMKDLTGSPDRPFFVNRMELAKVVTVR
jgi:hypothetical protein